MNVFRSVSWWYQLPWTYQKDNKNANIKEYGIFASDPLLEAILWIDHGKTCNLIYTNSAEKVHWFHHSLFIEEINNQAHSEIDGKNKVQSTHWRIKHLWKYILLVCESLLETISLSNHVPTIQSVLQAYNALTSGGDVPLTFHVYKLRKPFIL